MKEDGITYVAPWVPPENVPSPEDEKTYVIQIIVSYKIIYSNQFLHNYFNSYGFRCLEEIKEPTSPKEACSFDTKLPSTRGM